MEQNELQVKLNDFIKNNFKNTGFCLITFDYSKPQNPPNLVSNADVEGLGDFLIQLGSDLKKELDSSVKTQH